MTTLEKIREVAKETMGLGGGDDDRLDEILKLCDKAIAEQKQVDNPEADATPLANPTWWRGYDYAFAQCCHHANEILDGKADAGSVSNEPWESLRQRLFKLRGRSERDKAIEDLARKLANACIKIDVCSQKFSILAEAAIGIKAVEVSKNLLDALAIPEDGAKGEVPSIDLTRGAKLPEPTLQFASVAEVAELRDRVEAINSDITIRLAELENRPAKNRGPVMPGSGGAL